MKTYPTALILCAGMRVLYQGEIHVLVQEINYTQVVLEEQRVIVSQHFELSKVECALTNQPRPRVIVPAADIIPLMGNDFFINDPLNLAVQAWMLGGYGG